MSEPGRATTPADALEVEVQEALALCKGDALMALRVILIANSFLEARIDQLMAEVSAGYARRKPKKAPRAEPKVG